jgi:predicted transposase YbfD/YdcC
MQRQRRSERQTASSVDKGHGRRELRTLSSTISLNGYLDCPGVGQVCRVVRERIVREQRQTETAYYITSLSRERADAARLLALIRGHWGAIENGTHWVRDVVLEEDRCTIFRGAAAQNLAAFRNAALNWLRRTGGGNLAARIRSFTRNSQRLFAMFGFVK